jgi:hypothetical protein
MRLSAHGVQSDDKSFMEAVGKEVDLRSKELLQVAPGDNFGKSFNFTLVPYPIADGESAPTAQTRFCPLADR